MLYKGEVMRIGSENSLAIERAKSMLDEEIRCAVIKGDKVFTSAKRGIAPLIDILNSGDDYTGCVAADKIVGKAAALLYVKLGASEIFAKVIGTAGKEVLDKFGIKYDYETEAPFIRNRKGDGMCPMECTVKDISDPDEAFEALKQTLEKLHRGEKLS